MRRLVLVAALVLPVGLLGCPPKKNKGATDTPASTMTEPPPVAGAPQAPPPTTTTPTSDPGAPATGEDAALVSDDRRQLADAVAMLTTQDRNKAQVALERLQPLAQKNPEVAVVHYDIGVAWQIVGDDEQAKRAWMRAVEVDPKFARAWLNLGVLEARAGRPDRALANFQTGIRNNPESIELRVATIATLRQMKRTDEALAETKAALAINSKALEVYNHLALVYLDTNQLDLAKFVLEKAMAEIDGAAQNAQLHAALGQVHYRQGYPADALVSFKKALELDPMQVAALQYLANYHLDNRSFSDATPLWERTVGLLPKDSGARINLGISYRGEGRFEDAKRAYEEALRIDPKNPEPHRNLAVLYGDYMKAYDAAVQAIEEYRRAGGGSPAELDAWIQALRKEQKKAEDRKRREEERRKREEAEALEAEKKPPEPPPETPPAPQPDPSPW